MLPGIIGVEGKDYSLNFTNFFSLWDIHVKSGCKNFANDELLGLLYRGLNEKKLLLTFCETWNSQICHQQRKNNPFFVRLKSFFVQLQIALGKSFMKKIAISIYSMNVNFTNPNWHNIINNYLSVITFVNEVMNPFSNIKPEDAWADQMENTFSTWEWNAKKLWGIPNQEAFCAWNRISFCAM